ncbi:MAG: DUF1616 domain-containing protein [Methanophagales archaeon ANME-1-THS]|nr:MAG: DUF1616 domain-containing protein [Methanophagales archaeon ANME-1-THS]
MDMVKLNRYRVFVVLACVYAAFIFFLSSLSAPPSPPGLGILYGLVHFLEGLGLEFLVYPFYFAYRYPDKFAHMMLYLGFGLLLNRAFSNSQNDFVSTNAAPFAIAIGTCYAITDELHQALVPYRTVSAVDLIADFLGLLLAQVIIIAYFGMKRFLKSEDKLSTAFDLGVMLLFTFLAYLFVLVPPFNRTPLRIVFALPLLLFVPGYVLIAAMFPRKSELSLIERFTLSIGLSIAIFVFDGFAISVTPWRFRPGPIVYSLSFITIILAVITLAVRVRIPTEERFFIDLSAFSTFLEVLRSDEKPSEIERALIIALVGSIIIASGMLIYAKLTFEEERFTAFYILGEGGKAENYPKEVYLMEPCFILVGIENYEHAPANYTLQVLLGGYPLHREEITLADGAKWEEKVFFTPKHVAKHAKLEFLLYKDGSTSPYRSVHLWVDSVIDYTNLAAVRNYALSDLPVIKNQDMELESDWRFTENAGYFRGHFTTFYHLEENATVCGYVMDNRSGAVIPNARVRVSNRYGYERSNSTNESGYYVMQTIADHFWMSSEAEMHRPIRTEFEIADGETRVVNLTNDPILAFNMTLEELARINETIETLPPEELPKEVSTVKGYVIDQVTGLPIANASVVVRNEYGFIRQTRTNDFGYYEVNIISGRATIEVRAPGYAVNITSVVIASEHTVNPLVMPENSLITGYISDLTTGAPVSNAYLRVRSNGYANYTWSNASGFYAVRTIAGHLQLDAGRDGYVATSTEFDIAYGESRALNIRIEPIPPLATIRGYVSYNTTGLQGARVVVSDRERYEQSTLTDSKGYFELEAVPGHLWLDVLPRVYMASSAEFTIRSEQRVTLNVELDAFPESTFQIDYPSQTPIRKGFYGGIAQELSSGEGLAALSFKVSDSYRSNRSDGILFKQVLLNELVVWEDDVEGDEGWEDVKIPITLDNGTNRVMLRVYAKQDSSGFPVTVWWDDVRIEPFEEITKEVATSFAILDADGTDKNYPHAVYLGVPVEVIARIQNNEGETVNYILQVKLGGELLTSNAVRLEDGSTWEQRIQFTPNQLGGLLKLEFLLFKDRIEGKPYKAFYLWVSSDIDYDHLAVLKDYIVSPLPAIRNSEMESLEGWSYGETNVNFTGEITNLTSISPWYSYEISYPANTPFDPGSYAEISQNFTAESYPATVVIAFNVRDSYTGERAGFVKHVLLNDEVIWEDSVQGDERWQHVNVPVTLRATTNKLTLRVKGDRSSSDFPIQVWWDDVRIEPITAVADKSPTVFSVMDAEGAEKRYPTALHLGESAEVLVRIENNEHKAITYILQVKLDGKLIKTESKWLEHNTTWERLLSFTPDRVGGNQKLEFLLFKDRVEEKPNRYFHLWVSTALNYANLEPLLRYGIDPHPVVREGDMSRISAWTFDVEGNFRGGLFTENTSSPYSYGVEQYGTSRKGDYAELWQTIYASEGGVAVLSFNVRDSYEETSGDARNITKQVLLNGEVMWSDDVSGSDTGYVGWIEEEFVGPYWVWNEYIKSHEVFLEFEDAKYESLEWWDDAWIARNVPRVQSDWRHVDVPIYLHEGNTKLSFRVSADGAADVLPVTVYWDDVELKKIHELVKTDERVRMKRYGW